MGGNDLKKTLTVHYTLQQMAHWAAAAGVMSFATAFLLEKGFAASQVGTLLAANILVTLRYPRLERAEMPEKERMECCSLPVFFKRYK